MTVISNPEPERPSTSEQMDELQKQIAEHREHINRLNRMKATGISYYEQSYGDSRVNGAALYISAYNALEAALEKQKKLENEASARVAEKRRAAHHDLDVSL